MQFVKNGPDIPERLLEAHEEGHVVFFCGAGISYPARLPGFEGLVRRLYKNLDVEPNPTQRAALKSRQYDTAIGLLEADHVGGRVMLRRELAAILNSADSSLDATRTHEALLTLSQGRDGKLRLVTTNFDRLFEAVIDRKGLKVGTCQAPLLPVPKSRWDGLVYLHGLLSSNPRDSELDCLVVSSGDFGLAYLTERWAARFVSELFRHYTVCFVGYSLSDPVLRYMTDALAADSQRGESPLTMYTFGSYKKGKEAIAEAEWRAKNVVPILYQETKDHRYLHKTLHRWSETYRDGVRGKELIIVNEAIASPMKTTREDNFVGRVLWALSDKGGLPAKRFAEMDPVPSLDWLERLSENRYGYDDLSRFGMQPRPEQDDKLAFSLARRPAPYDLASWMVLGFVDAGDNKWDAVMLHLARWLTRHIDDPRLVLWLAKRGGQLHDNFVRLIDSRLGEIAEFERDGRSEEILRIRSVAPRAIPRPVMRTVWRVLLSGRIRSGRHDLGLYLWKERLQRDGWSQSLRLALRELLSPCIDLREPFRMASQTEEEREPLHLREVVDWDLKLRSGHVHTVLRELEASPEWHNALPDLLPSFNLILRDTLDLMRELGSANERSDFSYVHQPSISKHPQNNDFHDWTALIDLNRDAWLALCRQSVEQARLVAEQWWQTPYPLFKRLALFAAAQGATIPSPVALDWLLADNGWWLWSVETQREVMRLLAVLVPRLRPNELRRMEETILAGPPRTMLKDDLEMVQWAQIVDREVWLLLVKVEAAGAPLGAKASSVKDKLSLHNPEWKLAEDEHDEFPLWMGEDDSWRKFVATPRRRRELVDWLKRPPEDRAWQEDDWQQRCRENFPTTACALYALSRDNVWPLFRWREALQAWQEERLLRRSWRYMAPVLSRAPMEVIGELAHSLSSWLQSLAKAFAHHQELFFDLGLRILTIDYKDSIDGEDPVTQAVNHPVGKITDALLRWWFRGELKDGELLPHELAPVFTRLCHAHKPAYRHARVLLAAHVIALFRVDREWTRLNLLIHFDWQTSEAEARASWRGFLWSPRFYPPLFELIKRAFLETAQHYAALGTHGRQYAALLTFIALEPRDVFVAVELKIATEALPEQARQEVVHALTSALASSGERRAEYWRHRIAPYWKSVWPKSRAFRTSSLAVTIAELCIAADEVFPEALELLQPWLQPVEHPDFIIFQLRKAKLAERFPAMTLQFLNAIVDITHARRSPHRLGECLEDIRAADPDLQEDARFRHLMELLRQYD